MFTRSSLQIAAGTSVGLMIVDVTLGDGFTFNVIVTGAPVQAKPPFTTGCNVYVTVLKKVLLLLQTSLMLCPLVYGPGAVAEVKPGSATTLTTLNCMVPAPGVVVLVSTMLDATPSHTV